MTAKSDDKKTPAKSPAKRKTTTAVKPPAAKRAASSAAKSAAKPAAKAGAGKKIPTTKPAAKSTAKAKAPAAKASAVKPKPKAKAKTPAKAKAPVPADAEPDPHHGADMKAVGALVRRMRAQALDGDGGQGLSQAELAKRIGMTAARLKTLEAGGGRDGDSYALLRQIARACGLELQVAIAAPAETPAAEATSELEASSLEDAPARENESPPAAPVLLESGEEAAEPCREEVPAAPAAVAASHAGAGLQAALGLQGRHLLRTLDGLADGGREREISQRFRAGESPAAIAAAVNVSPAGVIQVLRRLGFLTRVDDPREPAGQRDHGTADTGGASHGGRRSSLAGLFGGTVGNKSTG